MDYTLIETEDEKFLAVHLPGQGIKTLRDDHPNFEDALAMLTETDEDGEDYDSADIAMLFDPTEEIASRFERVSERVTVAGGRIYFDGDEVNNTCVSTILQLMREGEDFMPFVLFYEKVRTNPNEHSQAMLFDWLAKAGLVITEDGDFIGYKGVKYRTPRYDEDGNEVDEVAEYESSSTGRAIVNGQVYEGNIPNPIGGVVEMPRSEVTFDPSDSCSSGLHVGTYSYAQTYAYGALIEVKINPRDVVSVPEHAHDKMRVCRYTVQGTLDAPIDETIRRYEVEDDPEGDFWNDLGWSSDPDLGWDDSDDAEDGQHPSEQDMEEMRSRAKRRHRGFVTYAQNEGGWTLVQGDGSEPEHWSLG